MSDKPENQENQSSSDESTRKVTLHKLIDDVFSSRLSLTNQDKFIKALNEYVDAAESGMELRLIETICKNSADNERKRDAFEVVKFLAKALV